MKLDLELGSPSTEGFSSIEIEVVVTSFDPAIVDESTLTLKTESSITFDFISAMVEREDDTQLDFSEWEEDTFYSLLCVEDQQEIERLIAEEMDYSSYFCEDG
ncbi:MAG: hypothetical protein GOVbin4162_83 [Prokaryotic dsDNA virus sp.]|nr:MAG: hypothetical protein GOVbin4162_83 [Prokaryotic dsDNA virus sp.]|tara:strand:+ start:351 stop:659 length:309 start_codon:yes stop_codon:yes gene_type:complete